MGLSTSRPLNSHLPPRSSPSSICRRNQNLDRTRIVLNEWRRKLMVEQPIQLQTSTDSVDALLEAARYDDIDDIRSLASIGVSLDSKDSMGRTALHMAAANGHLDIVEYLICQGADLNASNDEKNTPLHWACLNGRIEVVKKLILAGASLTILNCHERTPVDEAVSQGKMDVIDAINAAVAQLELAGVQVS